MRQPHCLNNRDGFSGEMCLAKKNATFTVTKTKLTLKNGIYDEIFTSVQAN